MVDRKGLRRVIDERFGGSQKAAADAAGVHASWLCGVLSGRIANPQRRTIVNLAHGLGVHPSELLPGERADGASVQCTPEEWSLLATFRRMPPAMRRALEIAAWCLEHGADPRAAAGFDRDVAQLADSDDAKSAKG